MAEKQKKEVKRIIDDFEKISELNSEKQKRNIKNDLEIQDLEEEEIFDNVSQKGKTLSVSAEN